MGYLSAFATVGRYFLYCPMNYTSFKATFRGHLLCEALLDHPSLY